VAIGLGRGVIAEIFGFPFGVIDNPDLHPHNFAPFQN